MRLVFVGTRKFYRQKLLDKICPTPTGSKNTDFFHKLYRVFSYALKFFVLKIKLWARWYVTMDVGFYIN